jgi:hypothetical protein
VAKPEPNRFRSRLAAERRLRHERVDDRERGEGERKRVHDSRSERQPADFPGVPRDADERDREEDLLPGGDRSQHAAAHPGRVEGSHDGVVDGETGEKEVESDDGPPPDGDRCDGEERSVEPELDDRHEGEGTAGGSRGSRQPLSLLGRAPGLVPQRHRQDQRQEQHEHELDVHGRTGHGLPPLELA